MPPVPLALRVSYLSSDVVMGQNMSEHLQLFGDASHLLIMPHTPKHCLKPPSNRICTHYLVELLQAQVWPKRDLLAPAEELQEKVCDVM